MFPILVEYQIYYGYYLVGENHPGNKQIIIISIAESFDEGIYFSCRYVLWDFELYRFEDLSKGKGHGDISLLQSVFPVALEHPRLIKHQA